MKDLYSIGEIATQTGISVDTIRVWERRYGRPEPVRLPSGHRRYTREHLSWLRRVAEALALGNRPGVAVRAGDAELAKLLVHGAEARPDDPVIAELLRHVHEMSALELRRDLHAAWRELGPQAFLAGRLAPFLTQVGELWAGGELEVRHEHLVCEVLHDLLRELRDALGAPCEGPLVLLATLAGELHSLGLHMVALACAVRRVRCQVLGTDVPNDQLACAAVELDARAVLVSVSLATAGVETDRRLGELVRLLPDGVGLFVGGRGARGGVRRGPRGLRYLEDFRQLDDWLAELGTCSRHPEHEPPAEPTETTVQRVKASS